MKKPKIFIETLNFFNFSFLQLCILLKKDINFSQNNLLIIQTGGIGDLVISTRILRCESVINAYDNVYFINRGEFTSLLKDYIEKVEIINLDLNKYRYNLVYRISFLRMIRSKKISEVYNLTSARSAWNDSLALCINARKQYCNDNNWITVYPFWKEKIQSKYTNVYNVGVFNEYSRMDRILEVFGCQHKIIENNVLVKSRRNNKKYDIIIAPFTSEEKRDWDIQNFFEIIDKYSLSKSILLVCSKNQEKKLSRYIEHERIDIVTDSNSINKLFLTINNSKVFVGLDSGITHIAIATSVKVIAIIGGGNYGRYLPKPNDSDNVYLAHKMDCFGCEWYCEKSRMECMSRIKPNHIITHINKILSI